MKIVITGSHGFIGTHLLSSLDAHDIVEWDTKIGKDIKDFYLDGDEDFVIHLAGLISPRDSINEPHDYWLQNVEYSKKVFDICKDVPMVYASSAAAKEYWRSPYGTTKKVLETLAHKGHVGLRFESIYGDGASDIGLITRIKNGTIKYHTNHIRDFVHIDDIIGSILLFIGQGTRDKLPYYEVGTGKEHLVSDVVKHFGVDVPLKEGDDIEIFRSVADTTEIEKLGWKAKRNVYENSFTI